MMKRILFFGFTDFADRMRASSLCRALEGLGYDCYQIEAVSRTQRIEEIVNDPKAPADPAEVRLPEPFILFCGMDGEMLNTALAVCRGNIRAVLTPSNSKMTACELCEHLVEEKRSFERREK